MAYHTPVYLFLFLPAVLLIYQITVKKARWIVLVLSGYIFFMLISGKLVVYLIGTTIIAHYVSVWLGWLKLSCRVEIEKDTGGEKVEIKKRYKRKNGSCRRNPAGNVCFDLFEIL